MAGANFDADDPDFFEGDEDGLEFASEEIQANLPGGEIDKARLILERYVRDFSKSVEKKILTLESALVQFEGKNAPSTRDLDELTKTVVLMAEREATRLAKLDVQLAKEFDGIETRLKTQKGLPEDFETIANARTELEQLIASSEQAYMAAASEIIRKGEERIAKIEAEEKVQEAELEKNQRFILERYINDMQKSFEKKLIAAETRLNSFGLREAPRTEDPERLNDLVDVMVQKQISIVNQQVAQMDKEYKALETRLQTQGGTQSDFDKIEEERKKLNDVLTQSAQELQKSGELIKNRGIEKINDKIEDRIRKEAQERAQAEGEKIFDTYLQANKEQLEPTLKEYATAIIGDLIGPYSAIRKDSDGRIQRREQILNQADEEAAKAAQAEFERVLNEERQKANLPTIDQLRSEARVNAQVEGAKVTTEAVNQNVPFTEAQNRGKVAEEDFLEKRLKEIDELTKADEFKTPRAPEGFQLQDIPSMARFVRGSAPFIALMAIDKGADQIAERSSDAIKGMVDPTQSTRQVFDRATLGLTQDMPLVPVQLRIFEELLDLTEQIAENTSKDVIAFSPLLMNATLNSAMRTLEFNMERAEKLDPILAGITDSRTDLELALKGAGDELLQELGPYLIGMMVLLTNAIGATSAIIPELIEALSISSPILGGLFKGLGALADQKLKQHQQAEDAKRLPLQEIQRFMENTPQNRNKNIPAFPVRRP